MVKNGIYFFLIFFNIQKLFDPPDMVKDGVYFDSTPCLDVDTVTTPPLSLAISLALSLALSHIVYECIAGRETAHESLRL